MKNRKGFTLVELLVTIVILGIITAMSIPLIGVIRDANTKRKYKTYLDSLVYNAKLYVDSYQEDLFQNQDSGCAYISYENLKDHLNIKDINIDHVTCDTSNTFIKVSKLFDNYNYSATLGCTNDKDHSKIYYPEKREMDNTCGVDAWSIIGIDISPSYYEERDRKKVNITVSLDSNTGIDPRSKILYGFYRDTSGNSSANEEKTSTDYLNVSQWHNLSLDIPNRATQIDQFKKSQKIEIKSKSLVTPEGETGTYRLALKIENLSDLAGADWKNGNEEITDYIYSKKDIGSNRYKKGLYNIDNTKPTDVSLNLDTLKPGEYNTKKVKIRATGTDSSNLSKDNELVACYSIDSDTCSKKGADIKNRATGNVKANKYYRFSSIKNLEIQLSELQDGSTHTVYLTVADLAANYVSVSKSYKVDHVYNIKYNLYNGSHGEKTPAYGVTGKSFEISNGYKTVTVRGNKNDSGAIIGSPTSGAQAFDGWSSKNLGSHAKYGTNSKPTKGWKNNVVTKNNYFLDLTDAYEVTLDANWGGKAFPLPTTTRIGYTCDWWSLPGTAGGVYMGASGANWTPPYNSPTTVDAYSRCTPNPYKISYSLNHGTSGKNAPTTGTYDSDVAISNPSKTITIKGNKNGTSATIGDDTSAKQTFDGWTSTTLESHATSGTSKKPTSKWNGSSTKNTHFMNLRETKDSTVTMVANWSAKAIKLPSLTAPVGYECSWWSKNGNSGGTNLGAGGANYTPDANGDTTINVYARCSPISYEISYSLNHGTSGKNAPTTGTYDSDVAISNPSKTITIKGNKNGTSATVGDDTSGKQTFDGWTSTTLESHATSGTKAKPTSKWDGSLTKNTHFMNLRETKDSTVTMVANWSAKAIKLPSLTAPVGYECSWWSKTGKSGGTNLGGGGASYTPDANGDTTINVYARCSLISYEISYSLNHGTSGTYAPTDATYDSDVAISNPSKTITIKGNKNGTSATIGADTSGKQTFDGWTSTTLESHATSGTSKKPTSKWNGSSTTNTHFMNLRETKNTTVTMVANWSAKAIKLPSLTAPAGYECSWWSESGKSGGTNLGAGGANYTPDANGVITINVYARCSARTYQVTYKPNRGSGSDITQSVTYGSNWSTKSAQFSRDGYTQDGWSSTSGGGVDYNLGTNQGKYTTAGNTVLYAHWKKNTYTLTIRYSKNNSLASVKSGVSTTQTAKTDENVTLFSIHDLFTYDFHTSNYWYYRKPSASVSTYTQYIIDRSYYVPGNTYSANDLASAIDCDLTKNNCTLDLLSVWRETTVRYVFNCNGGKIIQGVNNNVDPDFVGNTGNRCGYTKKHNYNESNTSGANDHNYIHENGTMIMRKNKCEGTDYYFVGSRTGPKLDENIGFSTYADACEYIQNTLGGPKYYDALKYADVEIKLWAEFTC